MVLVNHGREAFRIEAGDRIAQLLVQRVERVAFVADDGRYRDQRGAGRLRFDRTVSG